MRGFISIFLLVLVFSLLSTDVFAQDDAPDFQRFKIDRSYDSDWGRPAALSGSAIREARVLKKGILAPSAGDRIAFAEFLRQPNTGLVRLMPREVYDSQTYHTNSPVSISGGGAYYSFGKLTHVYGYGSDIEFSHSWLSVGFAGADYGMIAMLGDIPLDQVSLNDPRTQYLANYQPPSSEHLARAENQRFRLRGGVTIDGLNYQSRQAAFENWTYLLRSISYDQSDVLVALRVVRKDGNGSMIIAWKLLRQYHAPVLRRGK